MNRKDKIIRQLIWAWIFFLQIMGLVKVAELIVPKGANGGVLVMIGLFLTIAGWGVVKETR